jgi:hypothetical protein
MGSAAWADVHFAALVQVQEALVQFLPSGTIVERTTAVMKLVQRFPVQLRNLVTKINVSRVRSPHKMIAEEYIPRLIALVNLEAAAARKAASDVLERAILTTSQEALRPGQGST